MKTILKLLELRLNFPEPFIRNLSHNLGYGYKSNIFKTIGYGDIPIGIKNLKQKRQEQWDALRVALLEERREKEEQENTSSLGGKLTKKKTRKSYKLVKKSRKSRKSRKYKKYRKYYKK
jgi:predicted S18 family serine protease